MNLNRRLFLRGLGGASVAAPFLGSVVERQAKAQGVPVPSSPKRLIVMFTHYGCLTDRWFPENSHGALSASDFEGTSLEALAPHADKLLLPRGIRAMNEWTTDLSLGQGKRSPHPGCRLLLHLCPDLPALGHPIRFRFSDEVRSHAHRSFSGSCLRKASES